jgi:hypothetical protein
MFVHVWIAHVLERATQPAGCENTILLQKTINERKEVKYPFQIKAVISALRNVRGLLGQHESLSERHKGTEYDIFDWLQSTFGFQVKICWMQLNLCEQF